MHDHLTRPPPSTRRMIGRALRRRCPLCGGGPLFDGWLSPRDRCPRCGLRLDRGESDFFLGAYTINFICVELLLALFLLATITVTWPDVPWSLLLWVGAPLVVAAPIAAYPLSRTVWLALDLTMRPPSHEDFAESAEEGPGPRVS